MAKKSDTIATRKNMVRSKADQNKITKPVTKKPASAKSSVKSRKAAIHKVTDIKGVKDGVKTAQDTALKQNTFQRRPQRVRGSLINQAPAQKLYVYVCGEVSAGELGLGPQVRKVKRPRLNRNLLPEAIGVVQIATGGMHALALTHDNKILSWGVNDKGALGRDTTWEEKMVDIDDDASEAETNPLESTPTAIPETYFPDNAIFTQVAAGDSSSFALTNDGSVYGWGTFRNTEGKSNFLYDMHGNLITEQRTPVLLPTLRHITQIACGADHALALDKSGQVYAWGSGEQYQLGRRVIERVKNTTLVPSRVYIPRKKITAIGCGSYHSFAIDQDGDLWAWGLNSFGEAGIPIDQNDDSSNYVCLPQRIDAAKGKQMKSVQGGSHHSVGVTRTGECLVWGRADGGQCGIDLRNLPEESVVRDVRDNIRIVSIPTAVPHIKATAATAGSDHTIAITADGKAYSWGFNATFQTGQGGDDNDPDDITMATVIDNTALRDVKVNWAGAGGQYSIITAIAEASPMANNVN